MGLVNKLNILANAMNQIPDEKKLIKSSNLEDLLVVLKDRRNKGYY